VDWFWDLEDLVSRFHEIVLLSGGCGLPMLHIRCGETRWKLFFVVVVIVGEVFVGA